MNEYLEHIDHLIISAELSHAKKLFFQAGRLGLFKSNRLAFARVARRLHLGMYGLRILHPIISNATFSNPASAAIRSEYAASLIQVGACQEAQRILETVSDSEDPESILFKAFNCITQWDYSGAIPLLKKYNSVAKLSSYQRMVTEVNLVAALVYERRSNCREYIDSLIECAVGGNFRRLLGNLLLQKGEFEMANRNWDAAFQALDEALDVITDRDSIDRLLVEKWIAISRLYAYPSQLPISLRELEQIRLRARELKSWEAIRSCDFHQAIATKDLSLAQLFFFGTPYSSLKKRLLSDLGVFFPIQEYYEWNPNPDISCKEVLKVLEEGTNTWPLRLGQIGHHCLLILTQDFYRAKKIGELHSMLFPDQVFNPLSSPMRIRKIIERTRRGLTIAGIPLSIMSHAGMFSLKVPPGVALRVPYNRVSSLLMQRLEYMYKCDKPFTIKEVVERLGINYSSVAREIYKAKRRGVLQRIAGGRSSKYKFKGEAA